MALLRPLLFARFGGGAGAAGISGAGAGAIGIVGVSRPATGKYAEDELGKILFSADAICLAVSKRSLGFLSIAFCTISRTAGGKSGSDLARSGASRVTMLTSVSVTEARANGCWPLSASYSTTPSEKMSE